ncbi:MAG TPA: CPBP family intramembrane metalloprotease [Thermoflexales bacterium]|nr:CPBP family intramembrane metalloprotease [Thermoflexales bacterium]HQW34984.1 CPBP family intramembrane metalloprotease [Thermoflexales bacterium]HQZ21702.1 CPBP family intramembrane metalloprotease [Thermoflexales bacterium]HRA00583.1 CPBP family intramembrane metalloprotease [Thermoflexales bacterium]
MESSLLTLIFLLPFVFAILAANLAENRSNARVFAYLYVALLNAGLLFMAAMFMLIGVLKLMPGYFDMISGQAGGLSSGILENVNWGLSGFLIAAGALLGLMALLPAIRRAAAKVFNINPDSITHATALSLTFTALGANLGQSVMNQGMFTKDVIDQIGQQGGFSVGYMDVFIFPLLILSLSALFGVGWLTRRSWGDVVERLALTPPSIKQLGVGVGLAVALFAVSFGADQLWGVIDASGREQVGGLSQALMGSFTGLAGALAIGGTAAIGEELFFRGAYQPRFGVLFTALFFALFHTQYGFSMATLIVFILGLVIGSVRQRGYPIIVCILIHFLYNFISVILGS